MTDEKPPRAPRKAASKPPGKTVPAKPAKAATPVRRAAKKAIPADEVSNVVSIRPGSGRPGRRVQKTTTSPAQVEAAPRVARAVQLRMAGASYSQIAGLLQSDPAYPVPDSYSADRARADVLSALDKVVGEPTREYVAESIARLRSWHMALYPAVTRGEPDAIRVALSVEKNLQQLNGIMPGMRIELSGPEGGPIAISALASDDEALEAATAALDSILGEAGK